MMMMMTVMMVDREQYCNTTSASSYYLLDGKAKKTLRIEDSNTEGPVRCDSDQDNICEENEKTENGRE